ncbi:MAG: hypothetical protein GDA45_06255 [Chromatiales bacterium]|nr:hypothetical protein [Chromatiales bacterium]
MTAAVMYWVESGRLECIGAFGNKPGLKARGQSDGVGNVYERMYASGELRFYDGHATPVSHFIKDLAFRIRCKMEGTWWQLQGDDEVAYYLVLL